MTANKSWFHILLLFTITVMTHVSCGQHTLDQELALLYKETVPLIKSNELPSNELDQFYILDIRSAEEYNVSHLPGARMLDYETFNPDQVVDIPKDAKVLVYCSVGYRSERKTV